MELTFNKTGELYVAEFKADKEFSLHIERMNGLGSIKMQQNGAEGGMYADVEDFDTRNNTKPVIEYDSGAFVAPKWIRIESSVLPTYAAITTDGDVVEFKSQAKVVEITSNGTTSVEPDAGFSYLSKVDVKTNVPQGGGNEGGGTSSGGSNYEYLDFREVDAIDSEYAILCSLAQVLNVDAEIAGRSVSAVLTGPSVGGQMKNITKIKCVAIDFSIKSELQIGTLKTTKEWALMFLTQEQIDAIPRLTEEEFYNLNA